MNLTEIERARLLIAMTGALGVAQHPDTQEQRARVSFCELIAGAYDSVHVIHGLLVAEELEQHLEATGRLVATVTTRQIQDAYRVGPEAATAGLRLLGFKGDGSGWTNAQPGQIATKVRLKSVDLLEYL